uniref:Putative secreted protein n=1 Tax=Anopheles aquasalis TaxID=42839 RepID=T1E8G3_ANOAQ
MAVLASWKIVKFLFLGQFTGALKKETLEETLHWTRNRNLTIFQEAKTAIELASAWGEDYYYSYANKVNKALSSAMCNTVPVVGWKEMVKIVCSRTAASGLQHPYGFVAQGPPTNSLAKLNADKSVTATQIGVSDPSGLSRKAVNEEAMGLRYGTDSSVYRTKFAWRNDQSPESGAIASFDVPFGILGLGDPQNLQNMPFDRFAYWKGDVELNFQLNATPFQQGLAAAYFMPLASYESELANVTTNEFVFVQPDQNATYNLPIPFKYLRSVMNTIARDTESLGTVYFVPISSLKGITVDEVTVTVYSAFPNSDFSIPRPVELVTRRPRFYNTFGVVEVFDDSNVEYFAQGNSASTTNNYNITNAGGDMPVQITDSNQVSATQDLGAAVDVKIPMPLDNPPLCSGAIPIEQAFPGMATSHGVRPTRDMQLKPTAFSRQQMEIFNPAETKIETLLAKMCLLTKFTVTPDQPVGTELYHVNLNTRLGLAEGTGIPVNLAVLNQFMFWRADFEFTFVAVQTQYHSMRLRAITQYAAPSVIIGTQNTTYTSNMNFASNDQGTNYVHRELVVHYTQLTPDVHNAQTEFLRTYQGEDVVDPIQNYSLGSFSIDIANSLIAPDTVEPSVEICVFLRILNPKVAVPAPSSPFTWNDYLKYDPTPSWGLCRDYHSREQQFLGLDYISPTVSKIPLGQIDWLGEEPPAGNYQLANIAEAGFEMVFREITLTQTVRFVPTEVLIQKDSSFVTFTTGPINLGTLTPSASVSYGFLPRGSAVLRVYSSLVFEAQGPEVAEERQETAENIDEMQSTSVTKEEAPSRPNEVCKLEIGEKFEFCVSDIHEIGRRYIRMVPINNPVLDQFAVYSGNSGDGMGFNLNIPPPKAIGELVRCMAEDKSDFQEP